MILLLCLCLSASSRLLTVQVSWNRPLLSRFDMYNHVFFTVELKALVIYVTGAYVVRKRSIKVAFMDPADGDIGTIVARTCSNLIIFPRGVFKDKSFSDFARQ